MTRCPNCGSAVRIGAKFCTSCGFRLAVDETASTPAQAAAPSRSPFATTSSPAWRVEPDPVVSPATVAEPEPVVEAAWSAAGPGDPDGEETVDDALVADTATRHGDGDGDGEDVIVAASPVDDNDGPGRSWFAPAPPDRSGPISDDMIASLEADGPGPADQLAADVGDDGDVAHGPNGASGTASTGTVSTGTVSTGTAPTATPSTGPGTSDDREVIFVSSVAAPTAGASTSTTPESEGRIASTAATATDGSDDPLQEARSLVARLSDLLGSPALGGGGRESGAAVGATPGVSFESVADQADVDALRAVVASAQSRPRDVDVMLDLVLRADTIAAVIADRDLLLAALRGDEAAVEEQWPTTSEPADDEPSTYPAWGTP